MKEIKFRAWDNVKDKMYFTGEEDEVVISFDSVGLTATDLTEHDWGFKKLEHLQYMQYTGLKDKDGKDIYEGDIVLLDILDIQNDKSLKISDEQRKELFKRDLNIISYQNGSFGFYTVFPDLNHIDDREWKPLYRECDDLWSDNMKVVGNIYENPELLK